MDTYLNIKYLYIKIFFIWFNNMKYINDQRLEVAVIIEDSGVAFWDAWFWKKPHSVIIQHCLGKLRIKKRVIDKCKWSSVVLTSLVFPQDVEFVLLFLCLKLISISFFLFYSYKWRREVLDMFPCFCKVTEVVTTRNWKLMKPKLLTSARESHVMWPSEKEPEVEPVRACLVFRDNSHHTL